MADEIDKDIQLLGNREIKIFSFLLAVSLVSIFADLVFHLAGGFLAVAGFAGAGLAVMGLLVGVATSKSESLGPALNFVLAGVIMYFEVPVILNATAYSMERIVFSVFLLLGAIFLLYFFTLKSIKAIR